jgi:hypothetical protein
MNTAKQAMESLEYVRGLLEEKQAGFGASAELAPFFIPDRIESSEETMELTLPPGHHETIEKLDPAGHDYCHQMAALAQRSWPPWLALRILR